MLNLDRDATRRFFTQVLEKHRRAAGALEPLEELVLGVILAHPEYHPLLEAGIAVENREFPPGTGDTNPFLHMGMHIALREQVASDRPAGIRKLYNRLLQERFRDQHQLEHRMMECLGEALWTAQRNNQLPDETAYLECLRKI